MIISLSEYREPRRHALLLSVLHLARGRLLDDLITMLTKIMLKLQQSDEARLAAWQAERREASEGLVELLHSLVCAYQSVERPSGFHRATSAILDDAGGADQVVACCSDRLHHRSAGWPAFTEALFRSQRAVLLDLADVLPLKAMPCAANLLEALDLVLSYRSDRDEWIWAEIDTSFLPRQWRSRVRAESKSERYHRRRLEIAVCFAVAKALKSGDVYVPGSCSYGAYTDSLFPVETEPQAVADYLHERGLPADGARFTNTLRDWLSLAIRGLEQMARNECISLDGNGKAIVPRHSSN